MPLDEDDAAILVNEEETFDDEEVTEGELANELDPVFDEDFVSVLWLYDSDGTPFSADGRRDYTSTWKVIVRNKDLGPVEVCKAPGLPAPFSPYVSPGGRFSDLAAVQVNAKARREHQDDWQSWIITLTYSTSVPEGGVPEGQVTQLPDILIGTQNQPWLEPPKIEWDEETTSEAPQFDLDMRRFRNSVGQPFTPAPTYPVRYPVLVITRNQKHFDGYTGQKYYNAVNSEFFMGHPPGTCQCIMARGTLEHRGVIPYYRCTYRVRIKTQTIPRLTLVADTDNAYTADLIDEFPVDRDVWQPLVLDEGLNEKGSIVRFEGLIPTPQDAVVPIVRNGHPVSQPYVLDGKGKSVQPGSDTIVWLRFRMFQERDLNLLLTSDNP